MKLLALFLVIAIGCSSGKSVDGPRRAMVKFIGEYDIISGSVMMEQASPNSPVKIRGVIYGLEAGKHSIHIHTGTTLGERCENVGRTFAHEKSDRPAGLLGNVKTFSGSPSRTDISLISSLVTLYEDSSRSIIGRSVVIHAIADDLATTRQGKWNDESDSSRILACGLIRSTDAFNPEKESILIDLESPRNINWAEKSVFDGEQTWQNVRHPYYGANGADRKVPSNMNLEGVERPDLSVDSLSLANAAPTPRIWMTGYTYEYDYAGWTSTGIQGVGSKISGGAIKGRFVIEPVDESTFNVALISTKAKQFNEEVYTNFWEADPGQEVRIVDQQFLEKPYQIKFAFGKVESVFIGKDEPLWIVNFKRALAAQIQLQFDSTSGVFHKNEYDQYYAENTVYHAMEGASSGECETWYHVSRVNYEQIQSETEHNILPVPELCQNFPIYEIVKNRDFDKCRVLPFYNYFNMPSQQFNILNGAGYENSMAHADTVHIYGCTTENGHFIVQSIKSVDRLSSKPFGYETEAVDGMTIQYFYLKSAKHTGANKLAARVSSDYHAYQTLAYSYDDDYKTHGPLMGKPTMHTVNSPFVVEVDNQTLFKEAERLFSEIYHDLEFEKFYYDPSSFHIPDKIHMFRRVFASFDYPELYYFVNKYFEAGNYYSTKNQVLFDTLILTGTNPAFLIVRDYITKGYFTVEQAAQAISALPATIETPTKEFFITFFDFIKSDFVQQHQQLEVTAALSFSRLVYQACVNTTYSLNMFPKLVMGEFCSPSDSFIYNQFVPYVAEQIKSANNAGERMAYITALGNLGHEFIVPYIKPYITSCEPSSHYENEWYDRNQRDLANLSKKEMRRKWIEAKNLAEKVESEEEKAWWARARAETNEDWEDEALCNIVRTKAIFALTNLAYQQEDVVSSLLMPVFFNKAEETEVRLAALTLLFVSNQPQAFWTRVALSTWYEPNEQIAHYIYTTIASKVHNKDPLYREEAYKAESVMPFMKPFFWTSYVATNFFKANYDEDSRLGYVFNKAFFPGFESFIPSHLYNSFYAAIGPYFTQIFEYAIDSRHAEKFFDHLFGKPGLRFNNKNEDSIISPELKKIQEQLKIEARATGQPELYIYLNFFDNYQRFYTINPTNIFQTIQKQVLPKLMSNAPFNFHYHKYFPIADAFYRIPSAMGFAYTVSGQAAAFLSAKSEAKFSFQQGTYGAQVEGTVYPALQLHFSHKIYAEAPFIFAYPSAGAHFDFSFAFPGKYFVQGDFQSGKFQTSWEFLGQDKVRFAHHGVTPYTSIQKFGDFTPSFLVKDAKVVAQYQQPTEDKYYFGQKYFGLNFWYQQFGDKQAFFNPQAYNEDFFGSFIYAFFPSSLSHYEQSFYYDIATSETKFFKTFFTWASKSDSKFETPLTANLIAKPLFDTVFGDKIKTAGQQWVKEADQEWNSQKFQHIFKSLTNPTGYSFDYAFEFAGKSASVKSHRYGSSIAYAMDDRAHRGSLMMEKRSEVAADDYNFVFCAEFEGQFPDYLVFQRKELIKDDYERNSVFKFGFGKSCTDDRKVTFTSKWTRSEDEATPTLRAKWQDAQCRKHQIAGRGNSDECVAAHRLSAYLNKAVVTVDYNEMPDFVYNATYKFSNYFRHFYGQYASDNQVNVHNPENKITFESVYYPLAGYYDFWFYKPHSNTFYHGVQIHPIASVFFPKRMTVPRSVLAAPGVCLVGSETVTTFDGLFYNATLSGCDQVLTKDCSNRYKMAVLSREENDKKVVTVLLDNEKIELFPAQQKVKVNGMDVAVTSASYTLKNSENVVIAVIKKTIDNFFEVDSPISHMIRVLSDGKEVVVLGSPIHRGRLCGLCGSQTGNKMTDLTGPRECELPRDLMDAAWEVKTPAGCKSEISANEFSELRRVQEICLKERSESVFGISDVTPLLPKFQQNVYSSKNIRNPSQWTVYRNKMVVENGKRCFSTESVAKCVEGSQPAATEERKMGLHCVAQNTLSEKLNEEMLRRPLDELAGKQVDIVRVYTVPTICVRY